MRKPTKYSLILTALILIASISVAIFFSAGNTGLALILVPIIATFSLAGIILASREIYTAQSRKDKLINVPCLFIHLTVFILPIIFMYLLEIGSG
ncbi:hypothetical protein [Halobacillus sp. K22]|uniref:hypothetical protein n=1 Tax=Halobacillus sp. K22 TaxID=3457431 RepID=UPI003FCCB328